jgi:hypothetical protein
MDQIAVGNRVKVGPDMFSPVFMFTHKVADSENEFVEISTSCGHKLWASAGHYIYVNSGLSAACVVKAGDVVVLGSGKVTTVVSVVIVSAFGLFNPQTVHGNIVVNGILASTYTTAVEPTVAHMSLLPLRMLYIFLGFSTSLFESGSETTVIMFPGEKTLS